MLPFPSLTTGDATNARGGGVVETAVGTPTTANEPSTAAIDGAGNATASVFQTRLQSALTSPQTGGETAPVTVAAVSIAPGPHLESQAHATLPQQPVNQQAVAQPTPLPVVVAPANSLAVGQATLLNQVPADTTIAEPIPVVTLPRPDGSGHPHPSHEHPTIPVPTADTFVSVTATATSSSPHAAVSSQASSDEAASGLPSGDVDLPATPVAPRAQQPLSPPAAPEVEPPSPAIELTPVVETPAADEPLGLPAGRESTLRVARPIEVSVERVDQAIARASDGSEALPVLYSRDQVPTSDTSDESVNAVPRSAEPPPSAFVAGDLKPLQGAIVQGGASRDIAPLNVPSRTRPDSASLDAQPSDSDRIRLRPVGGQEAAVTTVTAVAERPLERPVSTGRVVEANEPSVTPVHDVDVFDDVALPPVNDAIATEPLGSRGATSPQLPVEAIAPPPVLEAPDPSTTSEEQPLRPIPATSQQPRSVRETPLSVDEPPRGRGDGALASEDQSHFRDRALERIARDRLDVDETKELPEQVVSEPTTRLIQEPRTREKQPSAGSAESGTRETSSLFAEAGRDERPRAASFASSVAATSERSLDNEAVDESAFGQRDTSRDGLDTTPAAPADHAAVDVVVNADDRVPQSVRAEQPLFEHEVADEGRRAGLSQEAASSYEPVVNPRPGDAPQNTTPEADDDPLPTRRGGSRDVAASSRVVQATDPTRVGKASDDRVASGEQPRQPVPAPLTGGAGSTPPVVEPDTVQNAAPAIASPVVESPRPVSTSSSANVTLEPSADSKAAFVASQLTAGIDEAIESKANPLRLRLDPPELGSVAIQVRRDGGQVHIDIEFESSDALRAARDGIDGLRESLVAKGIDVDPENIRLQLEIGRESKVGETAAADGDEPQRDQDAQQRQRDDQSEGQRFQRRGEERSSRQSRFEQVVRSSGERVGDRRDATRDDAIGRAPRPSRSLRGLDIEV